MQIQEIPFNTDFAAPWGTTSNENSSYTVKKIKNLLKLTVSITQYFVLLEHVFRE